MNSVLERQSEHRRMGVYDPKGPLFQLSKVQSKTSRQTARLEAELTALESREMVLEALDEVLDILNS